MLSEDSRVGVTVVAADNDQAVQVEVGGALHGEVQILLRLDLVAACSDKVEAALVPEY